MPKYSRSKVGLAKKAESAFFKRHFKVAKGSKERNKAGDALNKAVKQANPLGPRHYSKPKLSSGEAKRKATKARKPMSQKTKDKIAKARRAAWKRLQR